MREGGSRRWTSTRARASTTPSIARHSPPPHSLSRQPPVPLSAAPPSPARHLVLAFPRAHPRAHVSSCVTVAVSVSVFVSVCVWRARVLPARSASVESAPRVTARHVHDHGLWQGMPPRRRRRIPTTRSALTADIVWGQDLDHKNSQLVESQVSERADASAPSCEGYMSLSSLASPPPLRASSLSLSHPPPSVLPPLLPLISSLLLSNTVPLSLFLSHSSLSILPPLYIRCVCVRAGAAVFSRRRRRAATQPPPATRRQLCVLSRRRRDGEAGESPADDMRTREAMQVLFASSPATRRRSL